MTLPSMRWRRGNTFWRGDQKQPEKVSFPLLSGVRGADWVVKTGSGGGVGSSVLLEKSENFITDNCHTQYAVQYTFSPNKN